MSERYSFAPVPACIADQLVDFREMLAAGASGQVILSLLRSILITYRAELLARLTTLEVEPQANFAARYLKLQSAADTLSEILAAIGPASGEQQQPDLFTTTTKTE